MQNNYSSINSGGVSSRSLSGANSRNMIIEAKASMNKVKPFVQKNAAKGQAIADGSAFQIKDVSIPTVKKPTLKSTAHEIKTKTVKKYNEVKSK